MKNFVIDPDKIAKTLDAWVFNDGEKYEYDSKGRHKWNQDHYHLVLSKERKEEIEISADILMDLNITSEKSNFVSLSISLPNDNSSTLIAFREITNIIYQPERKKVIFESNKNGYYSVLELQRVNTWVVANLNTNLSKEEYEKDFKNY